MPQRSNLIPRIIIVYSLITGPKDIKTLKMALDTGASYTMIPIRKAIEIGYNPAATSERIGIFTASGTEYVPKITIASIKCLGKEVNNMEVVCHDLPPQAPVDGLPYPLTPTSRFISARCSCRKRSSLRSGCAA